MEKNLSAGVLAITVICMAVIMSLITEVNASDPGPLQDFCIAAQDASSAVFVNGFVCKDPKKVTTADFVFKGFNAIGDTNNRFRANTTALDVRRIPALNTQGVSIAHVDFGPFGLNTPHHHPRATEVFTVLTGTIYAGFISSENKLFSTVLNAGDVIVFPQGMIHFEYNLKNTNARGFVSFGGQFPGRVDSAHTIFGSTPAILNDVLTKAYQVDIEIIDELRAQFLNSVKQIQIEISK